MRILKLARTIFNRLSVTLGLGLALAVALGEPAWAQSETPSGTVEIDQVQVAFIGSANLGGGTLTFKGQTYEFTIGGLGIGGFGASSIHATGEVYGLTELSDFPGAYGQARYGLAVAEQSTGELWLQNTQGVSIRLDAERKGLALAIGADAIYIDFD